MTWCVYDKDHMSALWIKNTSESDPHSYEVTYTVTNKAQKKFWDSNRIQTNDLCDTGTMLYHRLHSSDGRALHWCSWDRGRWAIQRDWLHSEWFYHISLPLPALTLHEQELRKYEYRTGCSSKKCQTILVHDKVTCSLMELTISELSFISFYSHVNKPEFACE